jgi:hypothetical protein
VLGGALLALGLWNLLNLLFIGGALTAIDPKEIDHVHAFGIGTGIGSVLAPLIAMFAGGLLAGRLASHFDNRVAALHGVLTWGIASVLGCVIMAMVAGSLTDKVAVEPHAVTMDAPAPGTRQFVDTKIDQMNNYLKSKSAPTVSTEDFLDASRYAVGDGRAINRDAFIARLDDKTKLSRPEAEAALVGLGNTAPDAMIAGQQLAQHRSAVLAAAESTGNAMLAAGVGLFLCLATTIAGAIIGARRMRNREYDRPDTIPGHTTAPYPAATPADITGPNVIVE